MFFNQDFRNIVALRPRAAPDHVFTVDEHDDVRILLDRSRIPQVRKARPAAALLHRARELRERKNRHFKLACHALQRARDFRHLLHGRDVGARRRGNDELQIIDDDEPEAFFHLHAARGRAHGKHGVRRLIINIDRRVA